MLFLKNKYIYVSLYNYFYFVTNRASSWGMSKACICFTPKHTVTDDALFLTFHISVVSFYHVFSCGLVSDLNISSILFQYNHSVDLKYPKIALAVSLTFLRLPTVGSRTCNFLTLHSSTRITERTGQNPLFSWIIIWRCCCLEDIWLYDITYH